MTDTIRGEFTHIDMQAPQQGAALDPIAKAQSAMVGELARLKAPVLGADATAEDFEDVADYLLRMARLIDVCILEVGREVQSAAINSVDMKDFTNTLTDALTGMATYEIDSCAAAVREEQQKVRAALRHRRNVRAMVDDLYRTLGARRGAE